MSTFLFTGIRWILKYYIKNYTINTPDLHDLRWVLPAENNLLCARLLGKI